MNNQYKYDEWRNKVPLAAMHIANVQDKLLSVEVITSTCFLLKEINK